MVDAKSEHITKEMRIPMHAGEIVGRINEALLKQYDNSTLADLHDETFMPANLRKANQANDHTVMDAFGFDLNMTESQIVAELFKMYKNLTERH